jgi:hypothetical protein
LSNYVKTIVAVVGAIAIGVIQAFSDGAFSAQEIGTIVAAVLVALGVYQFPNRATS